MGTWNRSFSDKGEFFSAIDSAALVTPKKRKKIDSTLDDGRFANDNYTEMTHELKVIPFVVSTAHFILFRNLYRSHTHRYIDTLAGNCDTKNFLY